MIYDSEFFDSNKKKGVKKMKINKEYYKAGLGALNKVTMEGMNEVEKGEAYINREDIKRFERMDRWREYQEILNILDTDMKRYRIYQYVMNETNDNYVKKEITGLTASRKWEWKVKIAGERDEALGRNAKDDKFSAAAKRWKRMASEEELKKWFENDYLKDTPEEVIFSLPMKVIGMIDIFMRKIYVKRNLVRKFAWSDKGSRRSVARVDKITERDTYGWDDEDRELFIKLGKDAFAVFCLKRHRDIISKNQKRSYCNNTWEYVLNCNPELSVLNEEQKNELLSFDRDTHDE